MNCALRFSRICLRQGQTRGLRQIKPRTTQGEQITPNPSQVLFVHRHPSQLIKAALFTTGVCGASFLGGVICRYENQRRKVEGGGIWKANQKTPNTPKSRSDGEKTVLGLVAVNGLVFLLWQPAALRPFMYRYFSSSFFGEKLLSPMVLSMFSHMGPIHLGCNMYVLYSFGAPCADRFTSKELFLSLFIAGGAVSSLASHIQRAATKSRSFSVGASGAVLACLMYACAKMPESRLQIIFLPFFTFTAAQGILGILALDGLGLLLGWRIFDHAAHLGGSLFGLWYAYQGEALLNSLTPSILHQWIAITRK